MEELKGKNALITGSSMGIGRAVAIEFAKAGANVLLNYIGDDHEVNEVKKIVESYKVNVVTFKADVSDPEAVGQMYQYFDQQLGPIDILVNNAGYMDESPIHLMTDDQWQRMISVHLNGNFYNIREAVKRMLNRKSGKIINIASELGQIGCENGAHYSAAKGGIIALTKSLARELAPNILVNAVAPGGTTTNLVKLLGEDYAEEEANKYPLKRLANPEEIAKSVLFLASDNANFFTGQVLGPNGGAVMNS